MGFWGGVYLNYGLYQCLVLLDNIVFFHVWDTMVVILGVGGNFAGGRERARIDDGFDFVDVVVVLGFVLKIQKLLCFFYIHSIYAFIMLSFIQ